MRDHQVALGNHSLDVELHVGMLTAEPVPVADERFGAVGGLRIVLDVAVTEMIGDRLLGIASKRRRVVVDNDSLVLFQIRHDSPRIPATAHYGFRPHASSCTGALTTLAPRKPPQTVGLGR